LARLQVNTSPSTYLRPGRSAITWGGTIRAAAQNIRRRSGDGSRVVLLYGGLAERTAINPYDNAAMMARALGARCYYVTAPMFAHTEELCSARVSSKPVRSVLAMAAELDIALLSAVDLSEQSKALEYGVISRETWQSLLDAGAIGDICGHYLDIDGRAVAHPLTNRVIHPKMKSLLQVPERVLAAGGLQNIPIIGAAIRARLVDILVTDEQAAIGLLG
jgi:DNA-binding transcriptional regulator LsrR (DeoR family)